MTVWRKDLQMLTADGKKVWTPKNLEVHRAHISPRLNRLTNGRAGYQTKCIPL